ncbi:hypothetical protein D3C72_2111350 [compost metagenome]
MRQAIGLAIELAIAQAQLATLQGQGLWLARGLCRDTLVNQFLARQRQCAALAEAKHLGLPLIVEQAQRAYRRRRRGDHLRQHLT